MTEKFTFFWRNRSPFSQLHPCLFVVDSKEYCTAEQFMMVGKARLFGDFVVERKIFDATDPRVQKELGRAVTPFNEDRWNVAARDIVYEGNYAKFSQNEDLKQLLFATQGTTLVEASPKDRIWGIGLEATNPLALDRATWKGTNWLGEVLTKVRDDLMAGIKTTENFGWK